MSTHAITHEHHHDSDGTDVFGFWLYILTDCLIFGSLFATYFILNPADAYGPSLKEHINLYYVLGETFLLLASNFTFGLSIIAINRGLISKTRLWLLLTFALGTGFVAMEINEFINLIHEGYSYTVSGGASAFFTLVGTHGLHVSIGLLWILVTILQLTLFGLNNMTKRRLIYLGLFWNFLDLVWIFLFSFVYLVRVL